MNFNEQDFIRQLSIDCVIFGYQEKELKVLVPKINMVGEVFTLPGGFIQQNEGIDHAALRILKERTGIQTIYLDQCRTFGHEGRYNAEVLNALHEASKMLIDIANLEWFTKRFVSIGYYALVDINKVELQTGEIDESVSWYNVKDLPKMIMDHNEMVTYALAALRQNLDQKLIGFNLLPETFTMKEVQELYEAIYEKPFARNNFQKKILDLDVLERLEKKFTGAANKAPFLYRFRR